MIAPCRLLGIINCNNTKGVRYKNQSDIWKQVGAWLGICGFRVNYDEWALHAISQTSLGEGSELLE